MAHNTLYIMLWSNIVTNKEFILIQLKWLSWIGMAAAAVRIQCFNIISVTMQHNYLTLQGQEALFCVISFKSPQSLWHYQYLLLWTRHLSLNSEYACKQCLKMFRIELRDTILHTIVLSINNVKHCLHVCSCSVLSTHPILSTVYSLLYSAICPVYYTT